MTKCANIFYIFAIAAAIGYNSSLFAGGFSCPTAGFYHLDYNGVSLLDAQGEDAIVIPNAVRIYGYTKDQDRYQGTMVLTKDYKPAILLSVKDSETQKFTKCFVLGSDPSHGCEFAEICKEQQ